MDISTFLDLLITWATTTGIKLAMGLLLLIVGWKLIKKIVATLNKLLDKKEFDTTLHTFLESIVDLTLKVILIICVMGTIGLDMTGLAALVASAGLAVGLALQGSLSNFAGGVIILVMRPFKVGDYIEASGHNGSVEKIQIFYTYLVTPDNKQILIPNGSLANGSVVNYSTKETRRVDLTFGVGYEADILHVKKVLSDIINSSELTMDIPEPFIGLSEHGPSSVNFVIRVWTQTDNYWPLYFYLLEEAKIKFDQENISIPYPQMDLHIKGNELK